MTKKNAKIGFEATNKGLKPLFLLVSNLFFKMSAPELYPNLGPLNLG